jgi:exosome complex RNA-binding protein Rrp42 (RNase PH superfamily)
MSPLRSQKIRRFFDRNVAPRVADKVIYDVTEADLTKLVIEKGKKARVRANCLPPS